VTIVNELTKATYFSVSKMREVLPRNGNVIRMILQHILRMLPCAIMFLYEKGRESYKAVEVKKGS
jgi:hypothetical protein